MAGNQAETQDTVMVVTTGGTIASRLDPATGKVAPALSGAELVAAVPGLAQVVPLQVDEFCALASWNMTPPLMFELAGRIREHLRKPWVCGVVVTHGTDTLEETAFLVDVLVEPGKPVVFVGAQLNLSELNPDGPRNLFDAVRVASSDEARGLGVLVCFNGEINAARDVTKTHTSALQAFRSLDHGLLGQVDRDRVVFYRQPRQRGTLHPQRLETGVDLIRLYAGADGRFLVAAVAGGARALVVEAFGLGNVPREVLPSIRRATAGNVPLVITSRCPQGRVLPLYGAEGGGKDAQEAGAIYAGDLSGPKMRLLLMAALPLVRSREELVEILRRFSP